MKLNPDCVRDILLVVESIPDIKHYYRFNSETIPSLLPKYKIEEVIYHLRQCELNGFFFNPSHTLNYEEYTVSDLTPKGHEFLANIRSDTFFNKVKNICKELGLNSLTDLNRVALNCATVLIKSYFE